MRSLLVSSPVRVILRVMLPMSIFSLCAVMLARQVSLDIVLSLPARLGDIDLWRWMLAALFTAGSFWAVAQYDALAHRALGTGITQRSARITGMVGIALGQTLGFGVITGAFARWRMLAQLSLAQAARISAFVSISFVLCWAIVTALACLVLPAPDWTLWPARAVMAFVPVLLALMFFWPVVHRFGITVDLPSLRTSGAIVIWAFIDTSLAAAALFILLPIGTLDFFAFLPLFLIALGTGLISNTPGGVGPFELILLSAVPATDPAPIVAALLGFRIVYYAAPAVCAAVALIRPLEQARVCGTQIPAPLAAARSEVAAVTQNGGALTRIGHSTLALWPTAQSLVLFCDPVAGPPRDAVHHLHDAACQQGKLPVIYKCGAQMAGAARRASWRVLHIADEALVHLATYDSDLPARRTLRRKLRNAAKAGVTLRAGSPLPHVAMARVDVEWQATHGVARGGSMGRYCPAYVEQQWVGCAYVQGRLVAFATAHRARDEWCLDIMRSTDDAPDGTMHALVQSAITAARQAGARHFSLAAVTACPDPHSAFWRWAALRVAARAGGRGLRQFKSAFAPDWAPRYAAAPSWAGLALCLADIARTIHAPDPVTSPKSNPAHDLDENYEVDLITAA